MRNLTRTKLGLAACAALAALALGPAPGAAQDAGTIQGRVTDAATQRPLTGARVSVAGLQRSTVSGPDGRYTLPGIPAGTRSVRAEMLGYARAEQTLAVPAGGTATADLGLRTSAISLDALVATGTVGETQQRAVGTTVVQINAAEVVGTAPVRSVQDLINGRAPGVVILPGTGTVGSGARIRIRGISSLSLTQDPLIVVDGIRVNNAQATGPVNQGFGSSVISRWNDFNPDDIESIEVIKGPAAATLYGTEGANGVIQIITKRGSQGGLSFSFTTRQGSNWFANPESRSYTNYGINPATKQVETIGYRQLEELNGEIFRSGRLQEYDLNVSGGSGGIRYFLGGGWENNQGIYENNRVKRYSTRANVSITPTEKLDINASAGFVSGHTDLPLESGGGGVAWTTFFANPANLGTPRNGFHSATPTAYAYAYQDWQEVDRFTGSLQLTHRPAGWFTHRFLLGTDYTGQEDVELVERIADPAMQFFFTPAEIRGYKSIVRRNVYFNTADYNATAETRLAGMTSSTSVGAQYYRRYSEFVEGFGQDFPARGLRTVSATTGAKTSVEDYVENSTVGVYVQQQFGLREDRIFVTGALRMDDNSAFGENFDLVRYPKLSATWVLSEEPFWRVPFVNTLKLRAAYGESGQQPLSFASLRTFAPATGGGDQSGVTPQSLGNPDLGPERSGEFEVGFDAGLLDDRVGVELTYYDKRTNNAILERDIPPSSGFSGRQFINAGEIRNTGVELLLRGTPIRRRNAELDLTFSLATIDNEIVDLGIEGTQFVSAGTFLQHREGYPVGSWFERRIVDAQFDAAGKLIAGSEICDDGQGGTVACAQAPTLFLGRPTPDLEGAFTPSLTLFGNLRLQGMIDFKRGHHKLDGDLRVRCVLFLRCRENFFPQEFVDDPAWLAQTQRGGAFVNDLIRDASFTRFRELSATYSLPDAWARRFGSRGASVTVAGRNLYTWTDYTGMDPEASFLGGTRGGQSAAWEQNVTPQLQQFVATFNVNF
ncbi:MAG TPA: SusC/RagA family TonB-linked outer membrane protein [Longimicrobium sp.]|nr:SusC/RagA family TonB-linked outer membrane protein [Longimicrobium sp.]